MDQPNTTQNASWSDYFELITGGLGCKYQYKDTSVVELPDDLPQPPSDYPVLFSNCHYLVNIDALAKWDTSNMTSTTGMFNHCRSLMDISPLRYWNLSNVTDMSYMFNCCYDLYDVSAITLWDISNVTNIQFIFNGCHKLPDVARIEVRDQATFDWFVDSYLLPPPLPEPVYDEQSGENDETIFETRMEEEEEVYEPWDESTMGPHPFPENENNSMITILPYPGQEYSYDTPYTTDDLSDSLNDDLMMTLTPNARRKFLESMKEDGY